jgi:ABC-type antimicrobial peptide transport system permease subunit
MVLSEVLFVSIFGATAGFVLLRSASLWTYLSNRMPVLQIGVLTLSDFLRVFVTTVLFAIIFGTLPALGTLRLSPMDVFRND